MDVVESVRLMEQYETSTVHRWLQLVRVVENDILPSHQGRLVKSLGDGLMLEFPSVLPAVQAAFEVQHACENANLGLPAQQHIMLRTGAHVGHLITGEHDVYGSGVNLAARLATLAGPSEIVVSADVRDQLTPTLDAEIEDLGHCYLKHLHDPVRAYRVGPPGPQPVIDSSTSSMPQLRPTIAVIPFAARGGRSEHHVVGEVLADEIISALSRSSELNLISRLSTTVFRDRNASLEEVSRHLDADYVLSGAYRRTGDELRLTVELAVADTGAVVWSDSLHGNVHAVVFGRDELVDTIVASVSMAVMARELQRAQSLPLPTLESYTLLMGAIALMHRLSPHDFDRSRQMLQALSERAPRQAVPWAWMAKWHVLRVQQGWSEDPKRETQLALDCGRRALAADPQCSLALVIAGLVHTNLLKQLDVAQDHYELALSINPNDSLAWLLKGTLHAFRGEGKLAIDNTQRALKLSPLDPHRYFYDSLAATAALSAGHYKRAIELAKHSLRSNRTHTSTFRALAISQWQLGLHDDARKTVRELLRLEPGLTIANYMERSPSKGFETGKIWSNALREAGVPQ
ncbi:adenylate/guanylate cyclase domain-containing protein [Tardiphaga sp.]|uniref:adenylate/guanylate cyclase domain-containing protein n=1 Tax=Tardiphaga sp. TaxID=1926292 RepID=UPI0026196667|nr:adenylate/guanylate cyclase domain-containing protein [Tardiphaga sp.]